MSGTANLIATYSAAEDLRRDLGAPMANAFLAHSFRKAGMHDATPEFADQWHQANRMIVGGEADITGDIAQAKARSDVIVRGTNAPVAPPKTSAGNSDQSQDAA